MSDKKGKKFTFDPDHDGAEVPTLTSLLYRKNAVKPGTSTGRGRFEQESMPHSLEPTRSITIPEESLPVPGKLEIDFNTRGNAQEQEPEPVEEATSPALALSSAEPYLEAVSPEPPAQDFGLLASPIEALSIFADEPSASPVEASPIGLALVDAAPVSLASPISLSSAQDPLPQAEPIAQTDDPVERGLAVLQKRNLLKGALVLTPQPGGLKRFGFKRQLGRSECTDLWRGARLEIGHFGDLFNRLGKLGFVEFSPLALAGPGNIERQGFRTAFSISQKEWLTLIRIGSSTTPDSVVVVVSEGSIQAHLPFFHTAASRAAA